MLMSYRGFTLRLHRDYLYIGNEGAAGHGVSIRYLHRPERRQWGSHRGAGGMDIWLGAFHVIVDLPRPAAPVAAM